MAVSLIGEAEAVIYDYETKWVINPAFQILPYVHQLRSLNRYQRALRAKLGSDDTGDFKRVSALLCLKGHTGLRAQLGWYLSATHGIPYRDFTVQEKLWFQNFHRDVLVRWAWLEEQFTAAGLREWIHQIG